jgi:hypothetical protein
LWKCAFQKMCTVSECTTSLSSSIWMNNICWFCQSDFDMSNSPKVPTGIQPTGLYY